MIHELTAPTPDPGQAHPDLPAHQTEMIRRCPYLGPSVQRGLTLWSAYSAEPGDEPALFELLIATAEQVRRDRRTSGPLVCRNIAIHGPTSTLEAKQLMERPVWIARNLYAPVQIIVDRFWIGIGRHPGRGRSVMPHVPISYFMIRCGIGHRDRVIVSERPAAELAALRAGPGDDGRDIGPADLHRAGGLAAQWVELNAAYLTSDRSRN